MAYMELLNYLHHTPYLLAQCLSIGDRMEQINNEQMNSVVSTIATGLYGNAILSKDVDMVLRLLRDLIEIQVVGSENPRRMLQSGACSFARLYNRLHESLFSAKIFLTAALHEPIMKVLINDDIVLDIDANKAIFNYTAKERTKRFGAEGTDEYAEKTQQFFENTTNELFKLAKLFIQSLFDNWSLFPSTLRWVVQTMCHLLRSIQLNAKDINNILTDMIFTNFICPAIVSPDQYRISDAPISDNARMNLIQIGQIVQIMALMKHEDIDPKYTNLMAKFERNVIAELMEQLIETGHDIRVSSIALPHQNDFGREHVLVTQDELNVFVDFLRTVLDNDELTISGENRRKLGKSLDQLPDKWETILKREQNKSNATTPSAAENQSKTKQLINLGISTKNKLAKSISLNVGNGTHVNDSDDLAYNANGSIGLNNNLYHQNDNDIVLMIPITINEESKFAMLTEQEVLNMNQIQPVLTEQNVETLDKANDNTFDDELGAVMPTRKHARFSLSQDDQSIGNSDNLEVVSEAPSNHSVTSSMELEENDQNLNDNLSDMVSANVSGRGKSKPLLLLSYSIWNSISTDFDLFEGSPNISGRDTPSSQVTEGENTIPTPQMTKILNKARSDIDDKFCKFEIKKLVEGDETISIISDTWSTDVLASDSETLEPVDNERIISTPLIPSAVVLPGDNNFNPITSTVSQLNANFLDASDTRSESAWSTDVLASDSEKMTEVDTDDNHSIAAKSDTTDANRSEVDPIPDLIPVTQRAPDSPFLTPRHPSINFRAPDSPLFGSHRSSSSHFEEKRFNGDRQSPRFPNADYTRFASPTPPRGRTSVSKRHLEHAFKSYRTSSEHGANAERDAFFNGAVSNMRRQNSTESSISNQSSTLDDAVALNKSKRSTEPKSSFSMSQFMRDNEVLNVVKSSTDIINPFADDDLNGNGGAPTLRHNLSAVHTSSVFMDESVEHRRVSNEQRSASFDGRRNGISFNNNEGGTNAVTQENVKRFSKTMNYENHEIIAKSTIAGLQKLPSSATDDDKNKQNDEFLLLQKTMALSLNDSTNQSPVDASNEAFIGEASTSDATNKTPAKYTGAIPKSISFDSSADKSVPDRKQDGGAAQSSNGRNNNSFFSKIKQGFKKQASTRTSRSSRTTFDEYNLSLDSMNSGASSSTFHVPKPIENGYTETCDDILEKYRRKISSSSDATNSDSLGNNVGADRKSLGIMSEQRMSSMLLDEGISLYTKAKHNLRLVLSTTDLHTADFRHTNVSVSTISLQFFTFTIFLDVFFSFFQCNKVPPILTYLQIQLAQGQNLQNLQQVTYVSETIRSVNKLDASQQRTLIADLQSDLVKRQTYLQYLMRYHQTLLSALENINRFEDRLHNDREVCNRHLVMVCVRMFLKKCESSIQQFEEQFVSLTAFDEKIDIMLEFMERLMDNLKNDGILQGMIDSQLHEARTCIERILLQRLYREVMFPNDDADISRDE